MDVFPEWWVIRYFRKIINKCTRQHQFLKQYGKNAGKTKRLEQGMRG
jgi:hypothetical protein